MSATTSDAIERYQSQVPRLKREFAESLKELAAKFNQSEHSADYQTALGKLIGEEIRHRMTVSADSLSEALEAGWRPTRDQLDQAYTDSLNALDYPRKSFDDLFGRAGYIPGKLSGAHGKVIGVTMVSTSEEMRARLRMQLDRLLEQGASTNKPREYVKVQTATSKENNRSFKLTKVFLENYKSIPRCWVSLNNLTILVGANASGKSNFLDSIAFVDDALYDSLDSAIRERGGIAQLIRQTPGLEPYSAEKPPLSEVAYFEIGLNFKFGRDSEGTYHIRIGQRGEDFHIEREECAVFTEGQGSPQFYFARDGDRLTSSVPLLAELKEDRLYLPSTTSVAPFGDVFEGLTDVVMYRPDLSEITGAQPIDSGAYLADNCWNIASVVARLQTKHPRIKQRIETYLRRITRTHMSLRTRRMLPYVFLEYWQSNLETDDKSLQLLASSMSDGTLRATALLIALLQPRDDNDDLPINLVAFEEPETGLQPAALRVLFDAIQESSESRQVIFTTHSPDILDNKNLNVDSILAVEFRDGATRIGPIDSVTRSVLRDGLATPSELLRQSDALKPE